MKGIVTTELYSRDGRLLMMNKQPSRSLVLGFMKILYCQFTHSSWARQTSGEQQHHMKMAAVHGRGINTWERNSWNYGDNFINYPNFIGECYGIQITTDDTPVGPEDTRLKGRIGQGVALWKGSKITSNFSARGISSDRKRFYWVVDGYGQEIHRVWLYGGLVNTFYVGSSPQGCTYDGTYLWYSDSYTDMIYRINAANGGLINSWASPSTDPKGLAWDFTNGKIFSCDDNTDLIYRHNPATGAVEDSWAAPAAGPRGMEWLDDYLWIVCSNKVLYKINPATHAVVRTLALPPYWNSYSNSPQDPWGIAFDGLNWLLSDDTTYASLWWMYFPEYETNIEYSGMEIMVPTFSDPDGSMVMRRYFTNNSGGDVTIKKVGIHAGARPELIASDVLSTPITISNSQVLRVSYTFQITV